MLGNEKILDDTNACKCGSNGGNSEKPKCGTCGLPRPEKDGLHAVPSLPVSSPANLHPHNLLHSLPMSWSNAAMHQQVMCPTCHGQQPSSTHSTCMSGIPFSSNGCDLTASILDPMPHCIPWSPMPQFTNQICHAGIRRCSNISCTSNRPSPQALQAPCGMGTGRDREGSKAESCKSHTNCKSQFENLHMMEEDAEQGGAIRLYHVPLVLVAIAVLWYSSAFEH